ncbi:MAG: DUF4254 domain-containing protein [Aquabacterium sp.]|nr:DUF4254 domain-containing protein [Aquabacterium sp.]
MPDLTPAAALAPEVCRLHDAALDAAGGPPVPTPATDAQAEPLRHWIAVNHHHNASLWAEEDLARRTTVGDAEIAANKRAIDRHNQARNDATERIDEMLLLQLGLVDAATAGTPDPVSRVPAGARLNSETAGSMIDRLSILALKIHAMRQQCTRTDVDEAHRSEARAKLARLERQRTDLAGCLDALLADCQAGRAYFKVYRQFKMYNDPRFNPALVAERAARAS